MTRARISAGVGSSQADVIVDLGHPLLNRTFDGFVKIGGIGAAHSAAQEAFHSLKKGSISKNDLEHTVKCMGKEGLQWGVVAGVYSGMQYGMERVRGKQDWKNAMLGGAVTGALLACGEKGSNRDKVIQNAITGAAVATAVEFLRYVI